MKKFLVVLFVCVLAQSVAWAKPLHQPAPLVSCVCAEQSVTLVLNDTQIKALPTTPIEVVPIQGPTKSIIFKSANLAASPAWVGYGNISGSAAGEFGTYFYFLDTVSLGIVSNYGEYPVANDLLIFGGAVMPFSPYSDVTTGYPTVKSNASQGNALSLFLWNAAGNLIGGDPANTLKITVHYEVVDVN